MTLDFSRTLHGRAEFPGVLDALESHLSARGAPETVIAAVLIAADEVLANVLDHGGGGGAVPEARIDVSVRDGCVTVEVADDGVAFNPMETPAPDTGLSVEDRAIGGLGIHLVRKLMDTVSYARSGGRNRLRFSKTYS